MKFLMVFTYYETLWSHFPIIILNNILCGTSYTMYIREFIHGFSCTKEVA